MFFFLLATCVVEAMIGNPSKLAFNSNHNLRVITFTDMHYGEADSKDLRNLAFESTMVQLTRPNLVVIDGDASSTYAAPTCNSRAGDNDPCKLYVKRDFDDWTKPLREAEGAYAYVFGNDDPTLSDGLTKDISHTKDRPENIRGASNYIIPIFHKDEVAFYVWVLDSNDKKCSNQTGKCFYADQTAWYRRMSEKLFKVDGRRIPGIMLHHIPVGELLDAINSQNVQDGGASDGNDCCGSVNTGLLTAIREMDNVEGLFHGHAHNNDYVALIDGLYIGYGQKSGQGGYGGVADHPGARVFDIRLNPYDKSVSWSSHIRLNTGERIDQALVTDRPAAIEALTSLESMLVVSPMTRLKSTIIRSSAGFAVLVCIYGLYVEYKVHKNPDYVAMCDFSEGVNCSKVMSSEWSTLIFGIPNPVFGLVYYFGLFLLLGYIPTAALHFFCVVSVIFSALLAYVLATILKDFCLVCFAIYVVNGVHLVAHFALSDALPEVENTEQITSCVAAEYQQTPTWIAVGEMTTPEDAELLLESNDDCASGCDASMIRCVMGGIER